MTTATANWRDLCTPTPPRTEPHPDDLLRAGCITWDEWWERTAAERLDWIRWLARTDWEPLPINAATTVAAPEGVA